MPWVPVDTHLKDDPKVQQAGEACGPAAIAAIVVLLGQAKLRSDGGRTEVTYRDLGHAIFTTTAEARGAVGALVSAGVLTLESADDRAVKVKFPAWRKWNDRVRKADQRANEQAK